MWVLWDIYMNYMCLLYKLWENVWLTCLSHLSDFITPWYLIVSLFFQSFSEILIWTILINTYINLCSNLCVLCRLGPICTKQKWKRSKNNKQDLRISRKLKRKILCSLLLSLLNGMVWLNLKMVYSTADIYLYFEECFHTIGIIFPFSGLFKQFGENHHYNRSQVPGHHWSKRWSQLLWYKTGKYHVQLFL